MKALLFTVSMIFGLQAMAGNTFQMSADDYAQDDTRVVVPPGNHNGEGQDYDPTKYAYVLELITRPEAICVVKQAAELYQVDPVAIMGSIIGENTYNVSAWDYWQDRYLDMVVKWVARFEGNGIYLPDMLKEPKYAACTDSNDNDYDRWDCYNSLWHKDARGDGKDLKWTFFQPKGAGFTYGLGQFGPERALMVTDLVHKVSGFPILTPEDPHTMYDAILNPDTSIHYVAATNRVAIDMYGKSAHFDISQNPGIIATLYNIGKERAKGREAYNRTYKSLKKNGTATYPGVNYYGYFINAKQGEIQSAYDSAVKKANCQ